MAVTTTAQEQRMVLHNIGWDTYERLLRDHEDRSVPRFTYDRGTLEIMSPLPAHERYNRLIQLLLPVIAEATGSDLYSLGSTTFTREDLQRGFEPDSCFYVDNEAKVRGKRRIDLRTDPPPDLVLEIEVTNPSLNKLAIYRQVGVPEVWRYDGERLEMLVADGERYVERPRSCAFPALRSSDLARLLGEGIGLSDMGWIRHVRAWAQTLARGAEGL